MLRTKDLVLFLVAAVFLIVAIAGTLLGRGNPNGKDIDVLKFINQSENEYQAEAYKKDELSRDDRLADMRRKIAEGEGSTISSPEFIQTEPEETEDLEDPEIESEVQSALSIQCADYIDYTGPWDPKDVLFEVVESSLYIYKESVTESAVVASSGEKLPPDISKNILFTLPVSPIRTTKQNCLKTNVVGIAQGGSLIRNTETNLYQIFGSETVIGYALDGYPIFGLTTLETDRCGGAMVRGKYGYYLSADRDVVINCFTASPVSIWQH